MPSIRRHSTVLAAIACAAVLLPACGGRSTAASGREHVRGTIETYEDHVMTVATSAGTVRVQLGSSTQVATLTATDRSHIAEGAFLGIASATQPDGSQRAMEITVFPDSMRGTGEGHYEWDLPGDSGGKMTNGTAAMSKMTNGTVSGSKMTNGTVTARPGETSVTLQYKDAAAGGSQTIDLPPGIPVVALAPGQLADLEAGAHVFVIAHRNADGELIADRVLAGKNGVVPPM